MGSYLRHWYATTYSARRLDGCGLSILNLYYVVSRAIFRIIWVTKLRAQVDHRYHLEIDPLGRGRQDHVMA